MAFEDLKPLQVGDKAPDFTLPSAAGEAVTLSGLAATKPVLVVFGLVAFTGLCTSEACELRDNAELFDDGRVQVVAVTQDTKFALKVWGEQEGLAYPLLADYWPHGEVARQYGVLLEEIGLAARATFLVDGDLTIRAAFVNPRNEGRPLDRYREAIAALG